MIRTVAVKKAVWRGSCLLLVVEGDDDGTYIVRYDTTGDALKAAVIDWLSSGLASLLDLPVLRPVAIEISRADLLAAHIDSATGGGEGGAGLRLAVPCDEEAAELRRGDDLPLFSSTSDDIFLFDLLVGNLDRTLDNTGILRSKNGLFCRDYSGSLVMRTALDGRDSSMFQSGVFRRHPCYREGVTANDFRMRVQALADASLAAIAGTVPGAWLEGIARPTAASCWEERFFRALQIVRGRVLRLDAMIAAIERSQVDPEGRRVSRMLGRSSTFRALTAKIAPGPKMLAEMAACRC